MNPITAQPIRPLARGTLRVQSDARLVKLFRRGVGPAFDELVRRYRDSLVRYAGAIAGQDRAEDVVQESLVKAHRSLKGDQLIDPKPWLYKIVRNAALNDIRDNQKHRHVDLGDSVSRGQTPHDIAEQRERLALVVAAVTDLPVSQRRALIGHELGGFTHEEIAAELDLSTGAAKQLIYRARLTLRNAAGAVIPLPVVTWLASDATGIFAAGAATGVAAGSVGGGGFLASLTGAGAGATKLAVVAVVAGGSLSAGIAAEKHRLSESVSTQVAVPKAANGLPGGSSNGLKPAASVFPTDGMRSPDGFGEESEEGSDDDDSRWDDRDDGPERSDLPDKDRPSESRYESDSDDDDRERDRPENDLDSSDDDDPGPDDIDDDRPSQPSRESEPSGTGSLNDSDDEVIGLPPPAARPKPRPGPALVDR